HHALGKDHGQSIAAGESCQIAHIRAEKNHEGIQFVLGHIALQNVAAGGQLASGHEPFPGPAATHDPPALRPAAYRRARALGAIAPKTNVFSPLSSSANSLGAAR